MGRIFLSNDVTIFRSGENTFLRTPSLVLRFFEPRMSAALCDVASALTRGQDEQFFVSSFINRYTAPEVQKILELLKRYNLVHNGSSQNRHPDAVRRSFSLRGPFLSEEFRKSAALWPIVTLDTCCESLTDAVNESALVTLPETTTPVFLFSEYRRDELERLNRLFVKQKRDWVTVFRFFDDVFVIPVRNEVSPCFRCLPPLSLSDKTVDTIAVSASSEFTPAAAATLTATIFRELNSLYDYDSDAHRHLLRVTPLTGETHRILRLRDPLCPICAHGSLG
jgi:hypothetical protein